MGLRDLEIAKSYDSDINDILDEFLIPVLGQSITYDRISGFFSSTSLAVSARGLGPFIERNGKMRLICSARLSDQDIDAISQGKILAIDVIERDFLNQLSSISDAIVLNHVKALSYLLSKGLLEIKIALVLDPERANEDNAIDNSTILHMKVGILSDIHGDSISFSGSDNETAKGWTEHIEEFKVFRSWDSGQNEYLSSDREKFERFWNSRAKRAMVIEATEAIKKKLIELAPREKGELVWRPPAKKRSRIALRSYQSEAVKNWISSDYKGVFEMATGTGKTIAAIGCYDHVVRSQPNALLVVSCPSLHLIEQWVKELGKFFPGAEIIEADSSNPSWRGQISSVASRMRWGVPGRSIIVTSHDTLSSPDFIEKMKNINGKKMLIADEMHWLGARGFAEGLIPEYEMRLGLSATPKRWLDDEGTSILYAYFGETAYEFSLEKALTTTNPSTGRPFLTGYDYYPHFVEMTNIEMENYLKLTEKIRKASFTKGDSSEKNESLELLLIKRQKIIKNSESKYPVLSEILGKEKTSKYGLIYCTPEQIGRVQDLVNSQGIVQHKFTYRESATRRQELIEAFSRGDYNFLIAMKCLDEGVDIPATRTAIFMSSSGNPREYIQRRGRILRDCEGKTKAIVHDVIVLPTIGGYHNDLSEIEKGIVRKELTRYEYFANLARNRVDCLSMILKLKHDLGLIL